jgi:tRNA dimethylallyltransferase
VAEPQKPTAYVLLGPTASGKSAYAHELALRNACEIISMDSAQVYRGMDIGTAKPLSAARRAVRHHLIDILDPTETYSAGRFREDVLRLVPEIAARRKLPLIVGGTMLYFRALFEGLDELPPAAPEIRAQIDLEAADKGWPALHEELARVDPAAAARLKPTDAQRIQRALEVFRVTGVPLSRHQSGGNTPLPFALHVCAMAPLARPALHQRIEMRFDRMLNAGLVGELRELRHKYALHDRLPSMRAVGYRQVWRFLEGEISQEEMRDSAVAATRQLAKRQLTWLRSLPAFAPAEELETALSSA